MIKVKHPLESANKLQEDHVMSLPEDQRHQMAMQYSFGNASYLYYQTARSRPSEDLWSDFLAGIQHEGIRRDFEKAGYEVHKTCVPFLRFVNELSDMGFDEYIHIKMGDDYLEYKKSLNL